MVGVRALRREKGRTVPLRLPLGDAGVGAGDGRLDPVPEDQMVDALVDWAEFINEHGVDAAIARADTSIAEREAQRDRTALLAAQGADANHSTERIVEIRKTISSG